MLVTDPLAEPGHDSFNGIFFDLLPNVKTLYLSEAKNYDFSCKKISFSKVFTSKKSRIIYTLLQTLLAFKTLSLAIYLREKKVLYMSYELPSIVFVSFLYPLFGIKLYLIEHNTFAPENVLKFFLFRLISKSTFHITLAPFINKKISGLGKQTISIWHPLRKVRKQDIKSDNQRICFIPYFIMNEKKILFQRFAVNNRIMFVSKGPLEIDGNRIQKPYFKNYDDLLINTKILIIPIKYNYRVSGIFFEAIQTDAIIFMPDCEFSRSMKIKFESRVYIFDNWEDILKFDIPTNVKFTTNYENWNTEIFKKLKSTFDD